MNSNIGVITLPFHHNLAPAKSFLTCCSPASACSAVAALKVTQAGDELIRKSEGHDLGYEKRKARSNEDLEHEFVGHEQDAACQCLSTTRAEEWEGESEGGDKKNGC